MNTTAYVLLLLFAPPTGGATSLTMEFSSHESCLTAGETLLNEENVLGSNAPNPVKFVCVKK
jgi:hypothetical protein